MAENHAPSIKDDEQYEALRDQGMSRQKAARIANSDGASQRGGESPSYDEWTKDELVDRARLSDLNPETGKRR